MISLNKNFLLDTIKNNNNSLWKVNKVDYGNENIHYLIKYNKPLLEKTNYVNKGIYRSIVYDMKNDKIVNFSPPKSLDYDCEEFLNEWNNEDIRIEEFIDGIMIQVYYNGIQWEIATRSIIGAKNTFYHTYKTFKTMFNEACNYVNLDIQKLNKENIYSFVLQHPDNQIIVKVDKPKLYLVDIFTLKNNNNTTEVNYVNDDYYIYNATLDYNEPVNLYYPTVYQNNVKFDDVFIHKNKYCHSDTDYNILGMIIKNTKTGKRCKIRNENYNYVKLLRGNQPNLIYRFIELKKQNKLKEYLMYFPEDKSNFTTYLTRLSAYTTQLHNLYVSCYIKKVDKSKDYPLLFRPHMYNLHQQFQKTGKKIYINSVKNYVNHLENKQLFNIINFYSIN